MKINHSYILRVEKEGRVNQFWLQDIKTGKRFAFQTFRALEQHLQRDERMTGLK
jgi:hypothetical protein